MPATSSPAQAEPSRRNGARSNGPVTPVGKARSSQNGVRHGLSGRTFFLLADEDPAEFHEHETMWLAAWAPRDVHEHQAAAAAIRAMWREIRADRLEAQVLTDLFAAGKVADDAEREAAKVAAFKALATLLRYRGRIEREQRAAMGALEALRQRRLAMPGTQPSEPDAVTSTPAVVPPARGFPGIPTPLTASTPAPDRAPRPSEPEPARLNRHQRRALAAMSRRAA